MSVLRWWGQIVGTEWSTNWSLWCSSEEYNSGCLRGTNMWHFVFCIGHIISLKHWTLCLFSLWLVLLALFAVFWSVNISIYTGCFYCMLINFSNWYSLQKVYIYSMECCMYLHMIIFCIYCLDSIHLGDMIQMEMNGYVGWY